MLTRLLHVLTDFSSSPRGKFVVPVIWIVAAASLFVSAPSLDSVYDNGNVEGVPSRASSQVAQRQLDEKFPQAKGNAAIVVFSDAAGLGQSDRSRVKEVSKWLASKEAPQGIGEINSIATVPRAAENGLVSKDGEATTLTFLFDGSLSAQQVTKGVGEVRAHLEDVTGGSSLKANLTGPAGVNADAVEIFSSADLRLLLATVSLVLVLLVAIYRSPLLAVLPLVVTGAALVVVQALLGFAAGAGLFSINQQSVSIAEVLLFGAGVDYTIFIVARYREELVHTRDRHHAMRDTMRAVGEAIGSSAGTVILAVLALLLASLSLYSNLGPTIAISVFVALLGGLTLAPALLSLAGRVAYWPFVPRHEPESARSTDDTLPRGLWGRLAGWTSSHRRTAVLASFIFLGVLSLGNLVLQPSFNLLTAFRAPTDSGAGFDVLKEKFPAGELAPTTVLVTLHGDKTDVYDNLKRMDAINAALAKAPGVEEVQGPTRPGGNKPDVKPAELQAVISGLPNATVSDVLEGGTPDGGGAKQAVLGTLAQGSRFVSSDRTTAQFTVLFKQDPYSLTTIGRIDPLKDALDNAVQANGLGDGNPTVANTYVGGQTALLADQKAYNQRDVLLIVPVVLALIGLVLALLLRSLVAPIYLLAAVTLNFFAALGACSFFFQNIQGQDGINYAVPLYSFVFLVALGADYTILLMSRIREESRKRGMQKGVPFAVARTGGVITSAGVILAGTFAVLTSLPLNVLYQFGIVVAVGVLLDTFVVRGLLVPGIVLSLGKWNWWPGGIGDHAGDAPDTHRE